MFKLIEVSPGITLTLPALDDFMNYLTSSPHSHSISFAEFRDFLLLLPRKVSAAEIYRFYEMKKYLGDDGRGTARVTMEGRYLTFAPNVLLTNMNRRCKLKCRRQASGCTETHYFVIV